MRRGLVQATLLTIVTLGALTMGGCKHREIAHLTDHSSLNLVSITDGVHPWLALNVLHDPTDTDLCRVRWAPGGRTLAYLDGDVLYTWNPSNSLPLTGSKKWDGPFWSPDGQFIVVSSVEKTLVLDSHSLATRQQFDGENIVWWSGSKLCYTPRQFASKHKKEDVQHFVFGAVEAKFPPGLSLVSASADGAVLIAQTNYAGESADNSTFLMLGVDEKSGAVLWTRPAPTLTTKNYGNPDVLWNERLQTAAAMVDAGGGFDFHGYVENGHSTMELKFSSSSNYSWLSGPMTWIGDELFAPMTLARVAQYTPDDMDIHFWNELALFNGKTNEIRTVATGLPFEAAAASDVYVALVIRENDQAKIVITPWVKDAKGEIQGVTYKPPALSTGQDVAQAMPATHPG